MALKINELKKINDYKKFNKTKLWLIFYIFKIKIKTHQWFDESAVLEFFKND